MSRYPPAESWIASSIEEDEVGKRLKILGDVMSGSASIEEAAQSAGIPVQEIDFWRDQFLRAGDYAFRDVRSFEGLLRSVPVFYCLRDVPKSVELKYLSMACKTAGVWAQRLGFEGLIDRRFCGWLPFPDEVENWNPESSSLPGAWLRQKKPYFGRIKVLLAYLAAEEGRLVVEPSEEAGDSLEMPITRSALVEACRTWSLRDFAMAPKLNSDLLLFSVDQDESGVRLDGYLFDICRNATWALMTSSPVDQLLDDTALRKRLDLTPYRPRRPTKTIAESFSFTVL